VTATALREHLDSLFPESQPVNSAGYACHLVRLVLSAEAGGGSRVGFLRGSLAYNGGPWLVLYANGDDDAGAGFQAYNRRHVVSIEPVAAKT